MEQPLSEWEMLEAWADGGDPCPASTNNNTATSQDHDPCLSQRQIAQLLEITKKAPSAPLNLPANSLMPR